MSMKKFNEGNIAKVDGKLYDNTSKGAWKSHQINTGEQDQNGNRRIGRPRSICSRIFSKILMDNKDKGWQEAAWG